MKATHHPLRVVIQDYSWIHTAIGLFGNLTFFVGSILFFERFEDYKDIGVWLFVIGSFLMLIGSVGNFFVNLWEKRANGSVDLRP